MNRALAPPIPCCHYFNIDRLCHEKPIAHVSKVMFYVTLIHHHKIHSIFLHIKMTIGVVH